LRPDDAETLNNRGNALRGQRKLDDALASYDRALAAKPDHAHAFIGAAVGAGVGATIGALSQVELNRLVEAGQASRLAQGGQAT